MSDNQIENAIEKSAAESFARNLDRFISSTEKLIDIKVRKKWFSFDSYLERIHQRCSLVRVMIDREKIYKIDDIYVPGEYKNQTEKITDEEIYNKLVEGGRISIQGLGGAGKTILLKHTWLKFFNSNTGRIPIFVELRRLNDLKERQLITYIRSTISPSNQMMSEAIFKEFCQDGGFVFIFDGFDELAESARRDIQAQILDISFNYPKCSIIISSRMDDRFISWEQFEIYKSCPFSKNQVLSVVEKIDFPSEVKSKFVNDVIKSRYKKFQDFLSTPLLTLMMLFTYGQFGDVPEKVHIFYRYAFQTLYSLHDGSKEAFSRERKTGLNEDDFAKLFSYFCLLTYSETAFSFTEEEILSYVDESIETCGVSVDRNKFLAETEESVNLLQKEGDQYSFTHRSFQEYFAAFCIANYHQNYIDEIIYEMPRMHSDSVLMMLNQMNTVAVSENFIKPEANKFKECINRGIDKHSIYLDYLELFYPSIYMIGHQTNEKKFIFHGTFCSEKSKDYFHNFVDAVIQLNKENYKREIGDSYLGFSHELNIEIFNYLTRRIVVDVETSFILRCDIFNEKIFLAGMNDNTPHEYSQLDLSRKEISYIFNRDKVVKELEEISSKLKAKVVFVKKQIANCDKGSNKRSKFRDILTRSKSP